MVSVAASFGCASHPVPDVQLAASREAIANAGPPAGPELARAREKMALANHLVATDAREEARWLAEQAQVDAELAHATALATRATAEAARRQPAPAQTRVSAR